MINFMAGRDLVMAMAEFRMSGRPQVDPSSAGVKLLNMYQIP